MKSYSLLGFMKNENTLTYIEIMFCLNWFKIATLYYQKIWFKSTYMDCINQNSSRGIGNENKYLLTIKPRRKIKTENKWLLVIWLLRVCAAGSLDDDICCITTSSNTFLNWLLFNQLRQKSTNKCISCEGQYENFKS